MGLTKDKLIGLAVFTQSGQHLGKVSDFVLDTSSHQIMQYCVRSGDIIKELLQPELLINKEQVISIDSRKMVVEDNIAVEQSIKKAAFKKAVPVS